MTEVPGSQTLEDPEAAQTTTTKNASEKQSTTSDEARQRLSELTEQRRADRPERPTSTLADLLPKPKPAKTAEEIAAAEYARASAEAELTRLHNVQMWHAIAQELGQRYRDCRLDNFEIYGTQDAQARQTEAVSHCRKLAESLSGELTADIGLVLFGPPGTGKDHILAAMLRAACICGKSVMWINGLDFFGEVRDKIDSDTPESAIIKKLAAPDVLAISDPLPPWGPLTPFQSQTLFRVIDRRYRQEKPTWVTINVSDSAEASERIGAALIDRLRQRSLAVHCNWPSFRKKK